jgi:acetoacetyl-CoA synthetase
VAAAQTTRFIEAVRRDGHAEVDGPATLYRWSVDHPEAFWLAVWDFCGVIAETRGERVLVDRDRMPGARFFPEARLNFAENLLRRRDSSPAIVFRSEDGVTRRLTHAGLHDEVSRTAQALRALGLRAGDRVAGYLPNLPEAVIAMLATTSLGAVWSSCSPDFGVQGVVDRFAQIEPRVLFCADGYSYAGKRHDGLERLPAVLERLPSVEQVVVTRFTETSPERLRLQRAAWWDDFLGGFGPAPIAFERLPFDHPAYILFSSGTTGVPKCIVHGAGGTLLQHLKEHRLHSDVRPGDRLFYFTTCGWMMWNWLVSGLASEATLLLYDGSPTHPDARVLFDLAEAEAMTHFGTSARYLEAIRKLRLAPAESHDLSDLRAIFSTGSPLSPEGFDFVYGSIKADLCLSSISGGTDIISCFVLGNPVLPVHRGEIQCRGLGMRVEVFDEAGQPARGRKGELVCTAPFPSMPTGFWNDPDGRRYRAAYFERFPGVWCHGDYAELTQHDGVIIYGRSDAVLNPGGVRIGTAEIYRQVEAIDEVLESLAVGQQWQGDVRVVLFVRLREGVSFDAGLANRIRDRIRRNTTPRHVPAKIVPVTDLPRTKSGKLVELAVREIVHGREVKNREALANPEALELFRDLPELR